jgi:hypothetical protein
MQRRILEIIPGAFSWGTLILVVVLSWQFCLIFIGF